MTSPPANADSDLAGSWNEDHKAIVFVHGMGSHERGDTLMNFVSPLVQWARNRLSSTFTDRWKGDTPNPPQLKSYPREGKNRAYVRMNFGTEHRFELTEALWSTAFRPLPNDLLIKWSARFLTLMGLENWYHFIKDVLIHPSKKAAGWWFVPFEILHVLLLIFVFPVVLLVGWALIVLLWITDTLPIPGLFSNAVAGMLRKVTEFITGSLGDIAAYMEDPARRDAVRQVLEDILDQYDKNPSCKGVLVLAHSHGAVVAYDALSRRRDKADNKVGTLMTVGAILSPIRRMYEDSPVFYRDDVKQTPKKGSKWLFFYAPYDPGPAGPLDDWFDKDADPDDKVERLRADNRDTMIEDHVTYSVNDDQVISRLAEEMFLVHGSAGPVPKKEEQPYYRDEEQRSKDWNERRRRVATLSFVRMAVYLTVIGIFGYFAAASVVSATPAADTLNRLNDLPILDRAVGLLYKVPSTDDGSIEFKAEGDRLAIVVVDRSDPPQLVDRDEQRRVATQIADGWRYTTDEDNMRTAFWDFWVWSWAFTLIAVPAFFALLAGVVLFVLFRAYRDLYWKWGYSRWQRDRHEEYKTWRERSINPNTSAAP